MFHTRKVNLTLLIVFVVAAALAALPISRAANSDALRKDVATGAGATVTTQTFPNAVASGDTTRDSTVLWARSSVPGRVIFVVFPQTISRPLLRFTSAEVTDTSVPAKVER